MARVPEVRPGGLCATSCEANHAVLLPMCRASGRLGAAAEVLVRVAVAHRRRARSAPAPGEGRIRTYLRSPPRPLPEPRPKDRQIVVVRHLAPFFLGGFHDLQSFGTEYYGFGTGFHN